MAERKAAVRGKKKLAEPVRIRIKKNDTVKVIAGKDKGKTGRVLEVNRETGRILVEGVQMIKRHTRPNPAQADQGRYRREGEHDSRFERDGDDSRRRADAHRLQGGERRRRLPAGRRDRAQDGRGAEVNAWRRRRQDSESITRRRWFRRW